MKNKQVDFEMKSLCQDCDNQQDCWVYNKPWQERTEEEKQEVTSCKNYEPYVGFGFEY